MHGPLLPTKILFASPRTWSHTFALQSLHTSYKARKQSNCLPIPLTHSQRSLLRLFHGQLFDCAPFTALEHSHSSSHPQRHSILLHHVDQEASPPLANRDQALRAPLLPYTLNDQSPDRQWPLRSPRREIRHESRSYAYIRRC